MRLLVLGGTRFLGRGVVDHALAAGDQVTTFTRGTSGEPPAGGAGEPAYRPGGARSGKGGGVARRLALWLT